MASVTVTIIDPGSRHYRAELPDDAPIRRIMPVLVTRLDLPPRNSDGDAILYTFFRNKTGVTLLDDDTLKSMGVESDETFTLVPEKTPTVPKTTWRREFQAPEKELFDSIEISAPVYIPPRDSLAIGLVPADMVHQLEEYRSDEMRWGAIMWTFIGAVLGIIVNWATSDPIVISRASIVVTAILLLMTVVMWMATREYKKRADKMKARIVGFQKPAQSQ
jgi:hypothetical protein